MSAGTSLERGRGGARARVAGVALMIVSAVVGVLAAAFIGQPPWGVAAAILLAAATVGVAAGLVLQRGDEPDAARSGDGSLGGWSAKRVRRSALVYGAFLIAVSAVTSAGLLLLPAASMSPSRAWSIIGVFGVCGLALLGLALARDPSPVASSERLIAAPTLDRSGWLRLSGAGTGFDARTVTTSLFQYQLAQLPLATVALIPLVLDLGPWAGVATIAAVAAAIAVVVVIVRRRRRPAWIAPDGSALRHGSRTVSASAIAWASLSSTPLGPDANERSLTLSLGPPKGMRAAVPLRRRGRLVLPEAVTAALLELVRRSSIELPHDAHDPTGRFSKSFYPNHLTKAEALAVVAQPPADGEPLPIGPR